MRRQIVPPSLHVADSAAASVFGAARLRGPIARDVIAKVTWLSIATVNRQVIALLDAGVLRERADLAVSGAIGRPRVPVEVNHEPFLTLGIHIGARTTSIVATDLFGRTLDVVETPTPRSAAGPALASLADSARRYLSRWHRRRPLWVGVATGGVVDSATGHVDHPRLGWRHAPVGPVLAETLGLPVSVASHVDAMAGAELLLGMRRFAPSSPTSLYVYARETVGYALVIGGRVHCPASGPGTIAALPAHSELLGGTGQLESTVSDEAVLAAARRLRILPSADEPRQRSATGITECCAWRGRATSRPANCWPSAPGCSARRSRCCATCSTPTSWWSAARRSPSTPKAMAAGRGRVRRALGAAAARHPGHRVRQPGAGGRRGIVSLGGLYADPMGAMRRAGALDARLHDVAATSRPPDATRSVRARLGWPASRPVKMTVCATMTSCRLNDPRRVAVLSVHTSPLAQPGTGDAGGMNVYVLQTALQLARRGVEVEIFTRATSSADPPVVRVAPGVLVRNVVAGPFEGLDKYDLPTQLCAFAAGVLRAEADARARLLRHRALALLAVRSGRLAGPRPLGGAAGAHRAHAGRGQERRAGRR